MGPKEAGGKEVLVKSHGWHETEGCPRYLVDVLMKTYGKLRKNSSLLCRKGQEKYEAKATNSRL